MRAFDHSLELLQLDYVDMYMIHWPTPFDWRSDETWKAFRKLREDGRVRTLGVCNFMPEHLDRLFDETGEYPTVNRTAPHMAAARCRGVLPRARHRGGGVFADGTRRRSGERRRRAHR